MSVHGLVSVGGKRKDRGIQVKKDKNLKYNNRVSASK